MIGYRGLREETVIVSYWLIAQTHRRSNWTQRELSAHALCGFLARIGVQRVLVFPLANVSVEGNEQEI